MSSRSLRLVAAPLLLFLLGGCRFPNLRVRGREEPPRPAAPPPGAADAVPPAPAAGGEPGIDLEINPGFPLDSALQEIAVRTKRVVVADASVRNAVQHGEVVVGMRVHGLPREACVRWFARHLKAYAIPRPDGHVLLTRGNAWMGEEDLKLRAVGPVDGLFSQPDARDLVEPVRAALSPVEEFCKGARVAYEPALPSVRGGGSSLLLNLPEFAIDRVDKILATLRTSEPEPVPPPPGAGLDRKTLTLEGREKMLPELLNEIAEQAGVNVGCETDTPQRRTLSFANEPLSRALDRVAEVYGRAAPETVPGEGVWLGPVRKPADPPAGGVHPYLRAEVRAYPLILVTGASGEAIPLPAVLHSITKLVERIHPETDARPIELKVGGEERPRAVFGAVSFGFGRCMVVHPRTRRLVLIHDPDVHRAVAELLETFEREGTRRLYGKPDGEAPAPAPAPGP